MSFSEKVYRILLRAYPRNYLDQYAEPMEQLFRDRLRDSQTFADRTALWIRTLADWVVSVPVEYWHGTKDGATRHPRFASFDVARKCLFYALYEARSFSHAEITLEHLLLGILRLEPALVPDARALVHAIEAKEPPRRRFIISAKDLRLSRETARVWAAAADKARAEGATNAKPRDLLAGILCETDTHAARLLRGQLGG